MMLTAANLNDENLRACDTIALGAAMTLVREYGHTWEDFAVKHPELICHEIPAQPVRDYLVSGV